MRVKPDMRTPTTDRKVVPFSSGSFISSTAKRPLKIHGAEMSSRPSLPLIELCDAPTRTTVLQRVIARLHDLDVEQMQVVEIVIAAMGRSKREGQREGSIT